MAQLQVDVVDEAVEHDSADGADRGQPLVACLGTGEGEVAADSDVPVEVAGRAPAQVVTSVEVHGVGLVEVAQRAERTTVGVQHDALSFGAGVVLLGLRT